MIDALVRDLLHDGHQVTVLRDARLPEMGGNGESDLQVEAVRDAAHERELIETMAATSEGVVLIAPESNGSLETRAIWADQAGGQLLSPHPYWIAVAGNKQRCAEHLAEYCVPTPLEFACHATEPCSWPMLSKPVDGCGSQDLQLVRCRDEAQAHQRRGRRVEQLHRGLPVSVGVLCGPHGNVALQPCEQHLNRDLSYHGGQVPLSRPEFNRVAQEVALRAVDVLGPTQGYVGVDLVMDDPEHAVVVDINPRLTTSYVGLSRYHPHLARAMIHIACGESMPVIESNGRTFQFSAAGEVGQP